MNFKNLSFRLVLRAGLIVINSIFLYIEYKTWNDPLISLNLVVLLLIQIFLLIRFTNKISSEINQAFQSILIDGKKLSYTGKTRSSYFQPAYDKIDQINTFVKEKEKLSIQKDHFLNAVTELAGVGLIAFAENDEIILLNQSARSILRIPKLYSLGKLDFYFKDIAKTLRELKTNENKVIELEPLQKKNIHFEALCLKTKSSVFSQNNRLIHIVSFQNIKRELADTEINAWEKLFRVLTHEIMNSVSPIISTTKTMIQETDIDAVRKENMNEMLSDLNEGLSIIEERARGLSEFVNDFRSLTLLPKPKKEKLEILKFLDSLKKFHQHELSENNIHFEIEMNTQKKYFSADKKLAQQLFTNLIKNAVDALMSIENPRILISVNETLEGGLLFGITDNGEGIKKEDLNRIFIPFYTTKEKGSGIGLSLSQQIAHLHNGWISIDSVPNEYTRINLYLP